MAAGLRFEAIRGVPHSAIETAEICDAGLSTTDPDVLARLIWDWLNGPGAGSDSRTVAYWAIGKRYDSRDVQPLVAALIHELPRDTDIAFHIMIALDNLDEPVFAPERLGRSVLDRAENRADAERYLQTRS